MIRVLDIYTKLLGGGIINKAEEAQNYCVNERSIQRDINDIREYFDSSSDNGLHNSILYDRIARGYRLEYTDGMHLSNGEILAICKILLDSRAFAKPEMEAVLGKLVDCCVPKSNEKFVRELIGNEMYHYMELQHRTPLIDRLWSLGQAVRECRYIEIDYCRQKNKEVIRRRLKSVAIMFSEFYFYLTAFIDDEEVQANFDVINDSFPTIYRIDRIRSVDILQERFHIPYSSRFEEGEFRKRIQFMYGGKLQKLKFRYSGENIEAILDRLPTAKILEEEDGVYTVSAEVFGKGIDMWLRSQGDAIQLLQS
ncbi:MAG: WYL domain-containing protein [Firmicutes bacterium]|nr:WYL domain-containing protein [Bacillota bacterium]